MVTAMPNKKKPSLVDVSCCLIRFIMFNSFTSQQTIYETVENVPVRIGVRDLKVLAFTMLLAKFRKWSTGMPLNISDVELRNKDFVEFLPKGPLGSEMDVAAFYNEVYPDEKARGKKKNGKSLAVKIIEVNLVLPYEMYTILGCLGKSLLMVIYHRLLTPSKRVMFATSFATFSCSKNTPKRSLKNFLSTGLRCF
jgi:hypothetical protein